MYHRITDNKTKNNYDVPIISFEEQMQYLYQNGFKTIIPEEIPELSEINGVKWIMITFDDGYKTDYISALPILRKYGFKGVSFVTTGFLGKDIYMKWEQVQKLKEEGFSIQSHTHTHTLLKAAHAQNIEQELLISKKSIEEKLKNKVISLSLPGGSYSEKVKNIALKQEYRYIFNSKPSLNIINNGTNDIFYRVPITRNTTLKKFKNIVNLDKKTYKLAELTYSIRNIVKTCIGTKRYYEFWNTYSKHGERKWY